MGANSESSSFVSDYGKLTLNKNRTYRVVKKSAQCKEPLTYTFYVASGPHGINQNTYKVIMAGTGTQQIFIFENVLKVLVHREDSKTGTSDYITVNES